MTYGFACLADATRRRVLERVAERPRSVGDLAKLVPVSRPAVSQHLRLLKEAGLVEESREGTRRIYWAHPEGLEPLRTYLEELWRTARASRDVG
jgi:DNA-binding transcriptional ArsR family regulator